jgi:hypothetical protein
MKRLILLIITTIFVVPVFSQDMFQQLTGKYADKDGFSATLITNDMFDLYLRKKNIEKDSPVYETLKKLDNILVASQSKYGEKAEVDVSGIHSEILDHYKKGNYTLFKTEKRMGEDVKVYLKKTNDKVSSLALVTASSSSVNLVEMNGDIDLASIGDLSKTLNIRGLENLYKINGALSYQVYGGTFTAPDFYWKDFNSEDFFSQEKLKELQEKIKEQSTLTEEQQKLIQKKAEEMAKHQTELSEKYRQMAEQYGRQPIFLNSPGDSTTVYYIDGKKVKAAEVKKLDKDKIQTVEINKKDGNDRNEIRITTKK